MVGKRERYEAGVFLFAVQKGYIASTLSIANPTICANTPKLFMYSLPSDPEPKGSHPFFSGNLAS